MEILRTIGANWDLLVSLAGVIFLLIAWWKGKITTAQLLQVMDAEGKVSNFAFQRRAENLGNKAAAKAIGKIT